MRESGGDPSCVYPAGAPWGDWENGNGRHFDTGWAQVNDRHLDMVKRGGYGADMSAMLDAEKCLHFALHHLSWSDWGLRITTDATGQAISYRFDWTGWPGSWVAQNADASEAGFREWWDAYPKYAAALGKVKPAPTVKPMTPTTTPAPARKPTVDVRDVQPGDRGYAVQLVQESLIRVGLKPGPVDGQFGPRTQAAYQQWQVQCGYKRGKGADGAPGTATLAKLAQEAGVFTLAE